MLDGIIYMCERIERKNKWNILYLMMNAEVIGWLDTCMYAIYMYIICLSMSCIRRCVNHVTIMAYIERISHETIIGPSNFYEPYYHLHNKLFWKIIVNLDK